MVGIPTGWARFNVDVLRLDYQRFELFQLKAKAANIALGDTVLAARELI